MNKKSLLITIVIIVVGILIGVTLFAINGREKVEPVINIPNTGFTLNDIKSKFLETDYAKNNSCSAKINEENLTIKCHETFTFELEKSNLILNVKESSNKEIFKYLVDTIQTFYGSNIGDYYVTMDKFLEKELSIPNLYYKIDGDTAILKVNLTKQLKKYEEKTQVGKTDFIDKNQSNYIYKNGDYKIDNIEFLYNDNIKWLTLGGTLYGDNHDVILTLNLYNSSNECIYSVEDDLSLLQDQGYTFYAFVLNIDLEEINIDYNSITSYSIDLKEI